MTLELTDKIPCSYAVAKYVPDEIRDEPINIGVVLKTQDNSIVKTIFTDSRQKLYKASEGYTFIKNIMGKIERDILHGDPKYLDDIISRYKGKIRFTDMRGTLADNLDTEIESLFSMYVSIERKDKKYLPMPHSSIRKSVLNYLTQSEIQIPFKPEQIIMGKRGHFKYDVVIGEKKKILHSISFDQMDSLERTMLFDWNALDAIAKNGLIRKNFGVIVARPRQDNPHWKRVKEYYEEARGILESSNYQIINYERTENWHKELLEIL